jgi:hypothetical protein
MNDVDDEHGDAVHELLHDRVRDVYASADLADRVEAAAKRRRAARWSATGVIALVAVGTTIGALAAAHPGSGVSAAAQVPTCAANAHAYDPPPGELNEVGPAATAPLTEPLVPGDPVAAVLCRYAGNYEGQPAGTLAGSATVTDVTRLDQLRRAMNASTATSPNNPIGCAMDFGNVADALIVYPGKAAVRVIHYVPSCHMLNFGEYEDYFASAAFQQLLTDWTGDWRPSAAN